MFILTLIAAIILLVLDMNNVLHLSYWAIAAIGFSPFILALVLAVLGGLLVGLSAVLGGRK